MKTFLTFWLTVLTVGSYPTFAHDGDLDLTFGRGGIVITDFSGNWDSAAALAIQPDGKIVVGGWSVTRLGEKTDAVLSRYNEDGGLDLTFGTDGKVHMSFPDEPPIGNHSRFVSLAIQPDEKIVGLGQRAGSGFLVRFSSNGMLDTTFGNGGILTGLRYPFALAVQADGKMIVALGDQVLTQDGQWRFAGLPLGSLVRYNSDGTADTAFGAGGTVNFLDRSEDGVRSRVLALTIQPDGKIVAGGDVHIRTPEGFGPSNFAVARYNSNGQPDISFGTGGIVRTDILAGYPYASETATAVAIQPDGKIVAAGGATGNPTARSTDVGSVLVRYNSNGTLDTAFGEGGRVITAGAGGGALAIQADGKIIVAGAFPVGLRFGLARYASDGSLDMTFGMGGIVATDFLNFDFIECVGASAVAIQADGKIVAAGMSNFGWICAPNFAIARYNNDGPLTNISGINLTFYAEPVNAGNSFGASFLGMGITNETFFDVRFRPPWNPIGGEDQIALNWQQGIFAVHNTTIGATLGHWTITGVRPHRIIDDHTGDFIPVSVTLNMVCRFCLH